MDHTSFKRIWTRLARSVPGTVMLATLAAAPWLAGGARAQGPAAVPPLMRIVVPFSAGASNDVIARAIAPALGRRLGNTVIVENRPGVAGVLGADYVAKAPHDGSVLLLTSSTFLTAAATQARSPYDPLTAFAPVALVADGPLLLAVSSTIAASKSIHTPADLLAAARARPGAITYGSSGVGSLGQLATELMCDTSKVQMMHVPYKGAANALIDLAAGQIDVMMSNYSSIATQVKAGKVKPLAVTSLAPSPAFPGLPPLAASVPGYGIEIWVGVLAPAGTPAALVQRLNREIAEIAASPEVRVVLEPDGSRPLAVSPADFGARMRKDLAQWKRVAADRKIVAE
ncbi:tripartite tricarboxylate transporter substrate-binding protein [Cupriavidus necator]|uniref:tripartite tricarboxylate transporter substrate-binding protein n=1 Tax=Cupriavidus necator TaxID=106590 RepID=UPI002788D03F|nr:tripartite tricarboxylate transporter substrate-binding protein [Cupriavidus necator]MDQ0139665.1 tripartite-type tricarboxylate transporter receptor subunit TctC [Cupriavidus necator]